MSVECLCNCARQKMPPINVPPTICNSIGACGEFEGVDEVYSRAIGEALKLLIDRAYQLSEHVRLLLANFTSS